MNKESNAYCSALNMWCEEARAYVDRLEATNAALRERLDAANDLSVAVDDWAAGEASAEHLIQTNDDFVTFCPADHGIPLSGEEGEE